MPSIWMMSKFSFKTHSLNLAAKSGDHSRQPISGIVEVSRVRTRSILVRRGVGNVAMALQVLCNTG